MIFISYSHIDADSCRDLVRMAAPLIKYGGMQMFSDSDIAAGTSWPSTIQKALDKAAVAVLLVSRYFLESRFIMETEFAVHSQGAQGPRIRGDLGIGFRLPLQENTSGANPGRAFDGYTAGGDVEGGPKHGFEEYL
jgi:hypothetical protein